ncbi:MAG: cysteine protease [Erysipelotrichaceae bacterium]|nr:MAG: hypothetical protein FD179_438 [Erysipelotrichaceae bacterium]TXT17755.1 MAG: cysteine protease [Erysipelotrichaceae bacterium]
MKPRRKLRRSIKILITLVAISAIVVFAFNYMTSLQIKANVNSELGSPITLTAKDFVANLPLEATITLVSDLTLIDYNTIGTHEIEIKVNDKIYTSSLHIVDTTAPTAIVKGVVVEVGGTLLPQDIIVSITDLSDTTVSFSKTPNLSRKKTIRVILIVKDSSGNKSQYPINVEVVLDKTAPIIEILGQVYVQIGESNPDYWANANVSDAKSIISSTSANDDLVKIDRLGTYSVTLIAKDAKGNVASIERSVKVVMKSTYLTMKGLDNPENNKADAFIEAVLSEIITESMTQRQKMRAIYDWLLNEISYQTETSIDYSLDSYNKIDDYAFNGFKRLKGHCFHYAAMAAEMLDTLGLELTLIKGEGYSLTENDHFLLHYWVMVNIDGMNYHFDPLYEYLYRLYDKDKDFFLVKDSLIYSETHIWERNLYPVTP